MNLMKEIDQLGFVRGDKTALGLLIEVAEGLPGRRSTVTHRPPQSRSPRSSPLQKLPSRTAEGCCETKSALLDAIVNLRYRADKSALEAVLAEASEIDTAAKRRSLPGSC